MIYHNFKIKINNTIYKSSKIRQNNNKLQYKDYKNKNLIVKIY